jgi:hypothetical protein
LIQTHNNQLDLTQLLCRKSFSRVNPHRPDPAPGALAEPLCPLEIAACRVDNTRKSAVQQRADLPAHMTISADYNNICPHSVLLLHLNSES